MEYLTFSLAGDEYAVELLRVREIVEFVEPVRVPSSPPAIRGVVNLRGSLVPVADLAAKFGLAPVSPTSRTCLAIVEVLGWGAPLAIGFIAETVNDIVALSAEDIETPPPFGTRIRLDFLRGVGKSQGRLVLVLDLDRVLSPEELTAAAVATQPEPGAG
jgi:purine-binding chemotaxis protein CheW